MREIAVDLRDAGCQLYLPSVKGPVLDVMKLDGLVILLGFVVAIPSALAGMFWARYIGNKIGEKVTDEKDLDIEPQKLPKTTLAFAPIVVPILLIALNSIGLTPILRRGGRNGHARFRCAYSLFQPVVLRTSGT